MTEIITYLTRSIVDKPDEVQVTKEMEADGTEVYTITVSQEDMGRVIGRQGRIAKAIRTIAKSIAVRDNRKVVINIGR